MTSLLYRSNLCYPVDDHRDYIIAFVAKTSLRKVKSKGSFEQVKMRVKPGLPGKDRMTRSLHIEVG